MICLVISAWSANGAAQMAIIKQMGRQVSTAQLAKVKQMNRQVSRGSAVDYGRGIWSHHFMANRWRNNGNSDRLFWGAPKSLQMVTEVMKLKDTCSLEEKL